MDNPLVGAWRLISLEQHGADGRLTYPIGPHPVGYLLYSAGGHMSVQMTVGDHPRLASGEPGVRSDAEKAAALDTYRAYAGPYEIDEFRVVHHVEVSCWPDRLGVDLVRFYTLEGRHLHLRSAPFTQAGIEQVSYLTWERAGG